MFILGIVVSFIIGAAVGCLLTMFISACGMLNEKYDSDSEEFHQEITGKEGS